METEAPAVEHRDRGHAPSSPPEETLVSTIERNNWSEVRIYLVRFKSWAAVNVSVWYRNPSSGGAWHQDKRPHNSGPLLRLAEVPLVADAMRSAVERARQLGWEIR